jgi:hypothetical protein
MNMEFSASTVLSGKYLVLQPPVERPRKVLTSKYTRPDIAADDLSIALDKLQWAEPNCQSDVEVVLGVRTEADLAVPKLTLGWRD